MRALPFGLSLGSAMIRTKHHLKHHLHILANWVFFAHLAGKTGITRTGQQVTFLKAYEDAFSNRPVSSKNKN